MLLCVLNLTMRWYIKTYSFTIPIVCYELYVRIMYIHTERSRSRRLRIGEKRKCIEVKHESLNLSLYWTTQSYQRGNRSARGRVDRPTKPRSNELLSCQLRWRSFKFLLSRKGNKKHVQCSMLFQFRPALLKLLSKCSKMNIRGGRAWKYSAQAGRIPAQNGNYHLVV